MTPACMAFVERALERHPVKGGVIEVGSYDVNGSVRPLFANPLRFPWYIGVDMRAGPGVDVVAPAHELRRRCGTGDAGCVVSTEMLEHDRAFWLSLVEFRRVLRLNGYVILTTRGIGFPRHDYPSDYWRFTADGLRVALEQADLKVLECVEDESDQGVFAVAQKIVLDK